MRNKKMKINNIVVSGKSFAFDGCHKIYICETKKDIREAEKIGYDILPIEKLEETYKSSCGLRFIHNWKLNKTYVPQFEKAVFEW